MHPTTLKVLKAFNKLSLNGQWPTYREVSIKIGVSWQTVHHHVKKLARLAYVWYVPKQARSVRVTLDGIEAIARSFCTDFFGYEWHQALDRARHGLYDLEEENG